MWKSERKKISNIQLMRLIDLFEVKKLGFHGNIESTWQWFMTMNTTRKRFNLWLKVRNLYMKRNYTEAEAAATYEEWERKTHQLWMS